MFAYNIFLGQQIDQILCSILQVTECGHATLYKVVIVIILLPFFLQKQLKHVAMFSIFTLVCTLLSLGIVIALETEIKTHSFKYLYDHMNFSLSLANLNYKYIDWYRLPIVTSTFMAMYEGTSVVVTIYSETSEPKHFVRYVILSYTIVCAFGIFFGYFSYLVLGNKIDDIILLVLPNDSQWSIYCKVMYLVTIMGSYVIMI